MTSKQVPEIANLFSASVEQANIQNSHVDSSIYELTQPNGGKSYSALVYVGETSDNHFYNIAVAKKTDGNLGVPAILKYQTSMAKNQIDAQNYTSSSWQMDAFKINNSTEKTAKFNNSSPCPDVGVTIPEGGRGFNLNHISGVDFSNHIFNTNGGSEYTPTSGGTNSGWVQVCYETVGTSAYYCNACDCSTPHGPETCGDPTTNFGGTGVNMVVEQHCIGIYVTVSLEAHAPDISYGRDTNTLTLSDCDLQRFRDGLLAATASLTTIGDAILTELLTDLDPDIDYCALSDDGPVLPGFPAKSSVKSKASSTGCPEPMNVNVVMPYNAWQLFEKLNTLAGLFDTGATDAQKNWTLNPLNINEVDPLLAFLTEKGNSLSNKDKVKNIINSYLNSSLVSDFPFLQYPLNSGYETTYPKLTEYLENQFSTVVDIPKIVNAIQVITGQPINEIKEDLTWGNGPTIHITQLDNYSPKTSVNTVGLFHPDEPNVVHLDIDFVNELEDNISDQSQEDAYLFFLGTTLLHEYVHYGDDLDGTPFKVGLEEGNLFEIAVYGTNVNSTNAIFILEDGQ